MKKLLSILILLLATSANGMDVEKDSRVLNLNGCTGFLVDGNYIVSAKHCLESLGRKITLSKKNDITAELVYVPGSPDGPIVYHVKGKRYNSFRVADQVPPSGSPVYSIGFPGGSYAVITGKMIGTLDPSRSENAVSMRVNPGHSGGPLFSENGEAIGVALSVPNNLDVNRSNFASWGSLKKAMNEAKRSTGFKASPTVQKELVIFSYVGCVPCQNLNDELDYAELKRNGIKVTKVMLDGNKWSNTALVAEYKAKNGKNPSSFPTIWIRGSDQVKVGYKKGTRLSVFGWIMNGFKNIGRFFFGDNLQGEIEDNPEFSTPAPTPVPNDDVPLPDKLDKPPVEPQTQIETVAWENVSIVIAAKKQDIGYTRGKALEIALKAIKGPIQRANAEYFEGKANIIFVDERTQPGKYSSFLSAAGVDFDRFYVIVLVKKQSLGLKGFIASKVESSILEKLPEGVPIEIVFERIHSDSYFAITQSLEVSDTPVEPLAEGSIKDDIINSLKGQIDGVKNDLTNIKVPDDATIAEKVKANILPAVLEAAKSKDEDGTERTWVMRLMAGAMALFGVGKGVGGVRGWLAGRAMNKAKEMLKA
jgi:hypothetical protein